MKQVAIVGRDVILKLIPILNLDPDKLYESISLKASVNDFVHIEVKTIASGAENESSL